MSDKGASEMVEPIVYTDRYQALGMPYPDPATCCKGGCDGIGWYPLFDELGMSHMDRTRRLADGLVMPASELPEAKRQLWRQAHLEREHSCDGWHMVKCPTCHGTGKVTP